MIGNKLSAEMVKWQEQLEELKDNRAKWTARRNVMEEALSRVEKSRVEQIAKVSTGSRVPMTPNNPWRATSEGRYKESASWVLDDQIFKAWSQNFYPSESSASTTSDVVTRRVLWVSGSYGVGKTTIV